MSGEYILFHNAPEGVLAGERSERTSVTEAGLDAVCAKASLWKLSARQWFSGAEALRTLAAQLFGVDADGIADELPPDQVLERSDSRTFLAHSLLDQGKVIDSIPIYKRSPL